MPAQERTIALGLLGRTQELGHLAKLYQSVIQGQGQALLITGPANIGKQLLIETFTASLPRESKILQGYCTTYEPATPYAPWRNCCPGFFHDFTVVGSRRFEGVVPEHTAEKAVPAHATTRIERRQRTLGPRLIAPQALHWSFLAYLVQSRRPTVLVIHDLQHSDPATLELWEFLVNTLAPYPILLLATMAPLPKGDRALPPAVEECCQRLTRLDELQTICLAPLSPDTMGQFLDSLVAPVRLPSELATPLITWSQGFPFYLTQLLAYLVGIGTLSSDGTYKIQEPVSTIDWSVSIQAVVRSNLEHYDPATRSELNKAALLGKEVPLPLWRAISAWDQERFGQGLSLCIQTGILRQDGQETVRFVNTLQHEELLATIPRQQLAPYHRQIASVLEQSATDYGTRPGFHHEAGKNRLGAAKAFLKAALQAELVLDFQASSLIYQKVAQLSPYLRKEFVRTLQQTVEHFDQALFEQALGLYRALLQREGALQETEKALLQKIVIPKRAQQLYPVIARLLEYLEAVGAAEHQKWYADIAFWIKLICRKLLVRSDHANQAYYQCLLARLQPRSDRTSKISHYRAAARLYAKAANGQLAHKSAQSFKRAYQYYSQAVACARLTDDIAKSIHYLQKQEQLCRNYLDRNDMVDLLLADTLRLRAAACVAQQEKMAAQQANLAHKTTSRQAQWSMQAAENYYQAAMLLLKFQEISFQACHCLEQACQQAAFESTQSHIQDELRLLQTKIAELEEHEFQAVALLQAQDRHAIAADLLAGELLKYGIRPQFGGPEEHPRDFTVMAMFHDLQEPAPPAGQAFLHYFPEICQVYNHEKRADYFIKETEHTTYFLFMGQDHIDVLYVIQAFLREGMLEKYTEPISEVSA